MTDSPDYFSPANAEKLRKLKRLGFDVGKDGGVVCGQCGAAAVYLGSAKPGQWVNVGCSKGCKPRKRADA
jgi:hypothetical protein